MPNVYNMTVVHLIVSFRLALNLDLFVNYTFRKLTQFLWLYKDMTSLVRSLKLNKDKHRNILCIIALGKLDTANKGSSWITLRFTRCTLNVTQLLFFVYFYSLFYRFNVFWNFIVIFVYISKQYLCTQISYLWCQKLRVAKTGGMPKKFMLE